jgi:hypothetical protein
MTLAALIAFLEANGTWVLALWLVFEQYIATNDKLKANSTLQLVINIVKQLLGKFAKKTDAGSQGS